MSAESKLKKIFDENHGDRERQIKILDLMETYYWRGALIGGCLGLFLTMLLRSLFPIT